MQMYAQFNTHTHTHTHIFSHIRIHTQNQELLVLYIVHLSIASP